MCDTQPVVSTHIGKVGIIELSRPEKFNCLSSETRSGIETALTEFERGDSGIRAVLIRAQGKNFCTGADLDEVELLRTDSAKFRESIKLGHRMLKRLEDSPLPVVVAVNGLCLAGGVELMLACDVVFAGKDARIGDQHAQYGLVPGWGGTQRIPRIVGLRRGLDLLFSARWLDAETALQWGLVNYVCDQEELQKSALAYCTTLSERSQGGITAMKSLARQGMQMTLEQGLHLEQEVFVAAIVQDDVGEGLAAFKARRKPIFKD